VRISAIGEQAVRGVAEEGSAARKTLFSYKKNTYTLSNSMRGTTYHKSPISY